MNLRELFSEMENVLSQKVEFLENSELEGNLCEAFEAFQADFCADNCDDILCETECPQYWQEERKCFSGFETDEYLGKS